jgi:hypothetical protein
MCWLHVPPFSYTETEELASEYEAAKAQLEENDTYTQVQNIITVDNIK